MQRVAGCGDPLIESITAKTKAPVKAKILNRVAIFAMLTDPDAVTGINSRFIRLALRGFFYLERHMFSMLTNLTKAAVSVALSPIALVVDVVTLPASSEHPTKGAFDNTAALLKNAGKQASDAVK